MDFLRFMWRCFRNRCVYCGGKLKRMDGGIYGLVLRCDRCDVNYMDDER
jgi:hypothetical protein